MLIHRLELSNFRQHAATDLAFDRGLIGIVGPNGSGKTTLLEAIGYALYGLKGTRGSRDSLRRIGAPARARFEVRLEFSLGAHRYLVSRTRTAAELRQDGQVIANSTMAVTTRLTALLGMRCDEFFSTYFTRQKELAVMGDDVGPTERAQFLSRVIGYERLERAQIALRQERSGERARLAGIELGLSDPDAIVAEVADATTALEQARVNRTAALTAEQEALRRLTELRPAWTAAEERRAAWQSLDGERRVLEKHVSEARTRFHTLDQQLLQAVAARDRLVELAPAMTEWITLTSEREALDRAAAAFASRSHRIARRDQIRIRLEQMHRELAGLADLARTNALAAARAAALERIDAITREAEVRHTRWTSDAQAARTRRETLLARHAELHELRQRIEAQGPEGVCPTCGRALGAEYADLVGLLTRQLDEVVTDGNYYSQRIAQLGTPPSDVQEIDAERTQVDHAARGATEVLATAQTQLRQREMVLVEQRALDAELAALEVELGAATGEAGVGDGYDEARHEHVRHRLVALEPLRREHDQSTGVAVRAASLGAEVTLAEQNASLADAALSAIDLRIASLDWNPEKFADLEHTMRRGEAAVQQAQFAAQAAANQVAIFEQARAATLARQADRANKAEVARLLGRDINLLDELDRAYSDLRTELNLQLRPDLAERASALLDVLTAGRYADLDIDEAWRPVVVEDGEVKPVLSGGEEDIVNLAMRLAISELIAERAGQPLSLLILDEIFGSLDEERRAAVMALLRNLSERFPQVIVITHVEGLRDAFDRLIRLSYDVESGMTNVAEDQPELADVAV